MMVTGRSNGTSFRTGVPSAATELTPTLTSANPGTNLDTGIRKRELAGIDQHHRREAGNGLRHRMESKNRIGSHRNIGHHVTDAETLQIDWFSVLLDQYDGTWQFPCGNLIVEKFGDALEFIRRRNVSAGSRAYVDLFGPNRYQNGC